MGIYGKGVRVALIDSGIDCSHPALGKGFGPGFKIAFGKNFADDDTDDDDDENGKIAELQGLEPRVTRLMTRKAKGHPKKKNQSPCTQCTVGHVTCCYFSEPLLTLIGVSRSPMEHT